MTAPTTQEQERTEEQRAADALMEPLAKALEVLAGYADPSVTAARWPFLARHYGAEQLADMTHEQRRNAAAFISGYVSRAAAGIER